MSSVLTAPQSLGRQIQEAVSSSFPVSAAGLAKALKTDIPEIRRVLSGELPVGQTRLCTAILAVLRSEEDSPQRARLTFLKHLLAGSAASFLLALKSPDNTFFLGYCGLGLIALLSVYDFVKRRAWSTPPEWRIMCAFFFTPFALPATGLLLVLLAHLALIYALVRGTEPKVPT